MERKSMEIKVIERNKNELRIELIGEGHTFCNALQEILTKDETIDFVGYNVAHPLITQPVLYIRTKDRRKPETALVEGSKKLINELSDLQKALKKAFKE